MVHSCVSYTLALYSGTVIFFVLFAVSFLMIFTLSTLFFAD